MTQLQATDGHCHGVPFPPACLPDAVPTNLFPLSCVCAVSPARRSKGSGIGDDAPASSSSPFKNPSLQSAAHPTSQGPVQSAATAPTPSTPGSFTPPATPAAVAVTCILVKQGLAAAASAAGLLHLLRAAPDGPPVHLGSTNFSKYGYGSCSTMATLRWTPDQPHQRAPQALGWRLLTGHGGGQCLVWDLSNGRIAAVCCLGAKGPAVRCGCARVWASGVCESCAFRRGCKDCKAGFAQKTALKLSPERA